MKYLFSTTSVHISTPVVIHRQTHAHINAHTYVYTHTHAYMHTHIHIHPNFSNRRKQVAMYSPGNSSFVLIFNCTFVACTYCTAQNSGKVKL